MNFISESLRLRIVLVFVAFSILLGGALAAVLSAFFQITFAHLLYVTKRRVAEEPSIFSAEM